MSALEKIEHAVTDGYKKIENGVVSGYKKIEKGTVDGFGKISDKCIGKLFTREGETVDDAKIRMKKNAEKYGGR